MLINQPNKNVTYWFLGACYSGTDDQIKRFLAEGIWQNGYKDKYLKEVRSIQVGDRVAIKSAYTRLNNLPFDNRGFTVSVMAIKAIGIVTKNNGDGSLAVDWQETFNPVREWYFYTNRLTVWKVQANDWRKEELINFTFNNSPQDIDRFRNAPFWQSRFGDILKEKQPFQWTKFFSAMADKLLLFKTRQTELFTFSQQLADKFNLSYIHNKPLEGICPFTIFGMFNRGVTEKNRIAIAQAWSDFLSISEPVPNSFEGVPLLNNLNSWFFGSVGTVLNQKQDIENLWTLFDKAIQFADSNEDAFRQEFELAFNQAIGQRGARWKLTIGLFWIRPWFYMTLDSQSRAYITKKLGIEIGLNGPKCCNSQDYLTLLNTLSIRFEEEDFSIHNYPELSAIAWGKMDKIPTKDANIRDWKNILLNLIQEFCLRNKSYTFNAQDLLSQYTDQLQEEFPENNSISASVYNTLQKLRDDGILTFVDNNGQYELLDTNIELDDDIIEEQATAEQAQTKTPYVIDDILDEGCFLDIDRLENMISTIYHKKNIILQGPPGTGKTWLAKRLANVIIEHKDSNNLKVIQFHPNLSYEDFIRGYRPSGNNQLELIDGLFLEMVNRARNDAESNYVIVIEEINRGNPAQILGEMLTLLEADKRNPREAMELSYRRKNEDGIYIPSNLYIIGTMNIADRSLAIVDFALRRRFAFFNLYPNLNNQWLNYMQKHTNISAEILENIKQRIEDLNNKIIEDKSLGKAFTIGHSYFTANKVIENPTHWFKQVIETEIKPLLEEYYFDEPDKVTALVKNLLT